MSDLTVIFLTANEVPECWRLFHIEHLKKATTGFDVITVSRKPTDFGINLLDTETKSYANIYRQILRASKEAITKYIAVAEDDTLYSAEHFNCFRPKDDEFAYDRSRWSLFTWQPLYSLRQRISNCSLIASRLLLIEALEERFEKFKYKKFPDGLMGECGRNDLEKAMGITERKRVDFFSEVPIIQLSHPAGTEERQKIRRKKHGQIKAFDIPYWGKAENIIKMYFGNDTK